MQNFSKIGSNVVIYIGMKNSNYIYIITKGSCFEKKKKVLRKKINNVSALSKVFFRLTFDAFPFSSSQIFIRTNFVIRNSSPIESYYFANKKENVSY